jgi:hypothetical protein
VEVQVLSRAPDFNSSLRSFMKKILDYERGVRRRANRVIKSSPYVAGELAAWSELELELNDLETEPTGERVALDSMYTEEMGRMVTELIFCAIPDEPMAA